MKLLGALTVGAIITGATACGEGGETNDKNNTPLTNTPKVASAPAPVSRVTPTSIDESSPEQTEIPTFRIYEIGNPNEGFKIDNIKGLLIANLLYTNPDAEAIINEERQLVIITGSDTPPIICKVETLFPLMEGEVDTTRLITVGPDMFVSSPLIKITPPGNKDEQNVIAYYPNSNGDIPYGALNDDFENLIEFCENGVQLSRSVTAYNHDGSVVGEQ